MADSSAASYIHTVQHLIEECILFKLSKEECIEAISRHANIQPVITSTVWNELEKENRDFFQKYKKSNREAREGGGGGGRDGSDSSSSSPS